MSDSFTEVSSQGWLGRIGASIKGVLAGLLAVVISVPLLFWNEGEAVRAIKALEEGEGAVVSVAADKVDAANEKRLVHMTGTATTSDVVKDPDLGVAAPGIALVRSVEMYQWDEEKKTQKRKKLGGGEETETTYEYATTWDDDYNDSSDFKVKEGHHNPPMPLRSGRWEASTVTLGAFTLSSSLVDDITRGEALTVDPREIGSPAAVSGRAVHAHQGGLYYGANPASPAVGDLRVSYQVVKPQAVSILSMQTGTTFSPFMTSVGKPIDRLDLGTLTSAQMFQAAKDEAALLKWILRAVGWFVMFVGFALIFKPLQVVADVIPFVGSLVGLGTGLVAFGLSAVGSLFTIGIAWIFYRPLIGVPLVLGSLALIVVMVMKGNAARAARKAAGA